MSYPRRVLPGMPVMVTRRALRRTMLLRPDAELNNLFLYCLAVFSARLGIDVHHFVVMSNHYHLILTDTRGQLPTFLRELNRIVALGIKVLRRWDGAAWDHEKPSVVELRTEQAVIEEIAYATGNPTAAFAVRRAAQWPGLVVLPQHLGRMSWTARRPDFYFDQDSPQWPETATLKLTMPPLTLSDATVRDAVSHELERIESEAHDALRTQGAQVLGPQKVLAMSPYDRATSWEALRSRNPTFAVGRGQRDAFFEAVRILREFRKTYRAALIAWRAGIRARALPSWHVVHALGTQRVGRTDVACVGKRSRSPLLPPHRWTNRHSVVVIVRGVSGMWRLPASRPRSSANQEPGLRSTSHPKCRRPRWRAGRGDRPSFDSTLML